MMPRSLYFFASGMAKRAIDRLRRIFKKRCTVGCTWSIRRYWFRSIDHLYQFQISCQKWHLFLICCFTLHGLIASMSFWRAQEVHLLWQFSTPLLFCAELTKCWQKRGKSWSLCFCFTNLVTHKSFQMEKFTYFS